MGVRTWLRDDSAVSPVVGVTLLIVITVLLVAVILAMLNGAAGETPSQTEVDVQQSAFSFEFQQNKSYSPPNLDGDCKSDGSFDGSCNAGDNDEYIADRLVVTYDGGNDLPAENIRIRVNGDNGAGMKYVSESGYLKDYGNGYESTYTLDELTGATTVSAGDDFIIVTNYGDTILSPSSPQHPGELLRNVDSVQMIWEGDESTQIISEWEPN